MEYLDIVKHSLDDQSKLSIDYSLNSIINTLVIDFVDELLADSRINELDVVIKSDLKSVRNSLVKEISLVI